MEIVVFSVILAFLALLFIVFGFKLVEINTLNLFMFRLGTLVRECAKGIILAPLAAVLLGITTYESGLFAHFNQAIAYQDQSSLKRVSWMLYWTRLGQVIFVWILFQPLWVFTLLIAAVFILLLAIERKIFPFMLAVLLGLFLIKYGAFMFNFAGDYYQKFGNEGFLAAAQQSFKSMLWPPLMLGIFSGLLFCSFAPALIIAAFSAEFLNLTSSQGVLVVSGIFFALGGYSFLIERKSRGLLGEIVRIRKIQEWAFALLFLLLGLSGIRLMPTPQDPGAFIAGVGGIILAGSLILGVALPLLTPSQERLEGLTYYVRYAFSSCFAGIKLFIHQLTRCIVPFAFYTQLLEDRLRGGVSKFDEEKIHKDFVAHFTELKHYIDILKKNGDGTNAAAQVPFMDEMLNDLKGIEGNLYLKTKAMQELSLSAEADEATLDKLDALIQGEDAVLATYISLMQDPNQEDIDLMRKITQALQGHLETAQMGDSAVFADFLRLYKANIGHIQSLSNHMEKWVNFLPRYDLRHSRLQQV